MPTKFPSPEDQLTTNILRDLLYANDDEVYLVSPAAPNEFIIHTKLGRQFTLMLLVEDKRAMVVEWAVEAWDEDVAIKARTKLRSEIRAAQARQAGGATILGG